MFTLFRATEPDEIKLTLNKILYGKKRLRHEALQTALICLSVTSGVGAFASFLACAILEITHAPHMRAVRAFYAMLGLGGYTFLSESVVTRLVDNPLPIDAPHLPGETDGMMAAKAVRNLIVR